MLDLFQPPNAQEIVALVRPSRVHLLDAKRDAPVTVPKERPPRDKDSISRRMQHAATAAGEHRRDVESQGEGRGRADRRTSDLFLRFKRQRRIKGSSYR